MLCGEKEGKKKKKRKKDKQATKAAAASVPMLGPLGANISASSLSVCLCVVCGFLASKKQKYRLEN